MITAILSIYIGVSAVLLIYSMVEFSLLLMFLFRKKKHSKKQWNELPRVTVQLPMYNETHVVERLIDAVSKLNYPKDKLDIQVLDDSTDDTIEKAKKKVEFYQKQGLNIEYIRRPDRVGFKAGALDYSMEFAKGEFIAIFDADFLPDPEFLMKAMPYFDNPKVGVVQSRWTYINDDYSLLTRLQTVMLNTHFSVEQLGRNSSGAYINFNGTAGIWRKECIYDSGGWLADTLTEDLDLSFRAQIRGWKFKYAAEIESPSELPVTFPGYKAQQFRWSKGAAECAKKNIIGLWRAKGPSFWAKWIGSFHLLNSSVYLVVLSFILLAFPLSYAFQHIQSNSLLLQIVPVFMMSNLLLLCVFIGGNTIERKSFVDWLLFPIVFLSFLIVNMGMSLYMAIGVAEGYLGRKSEFVRTPKFNIRNKDHSAKGNSYSKIKITPLLVLEMLLIGYGIFQIVYTVMNGDVFGTVFASMFTIGFSYNVITTIYYSVVGQS